MFFNRIMAATFVAAGISAATSAWSAPSDYRFEIDGQPTKSGEVTLVKVRLVHVPDNKPVAGAVIVQTRLDMGPEGMAEMTAPAKASPATAPGLYQIEARPSMAGNWGLTLGAKVQGEPETVQGTVTVPVAQ